MALPRKPAKVWNGERLAQPARLDHRAQDGIVGGVVDRVGDAAQRHGAQDPRVERKQPDGDIGRATQDQAADQHAPGAEAINGIAHGRLHQAADDVEQGDRKAEFDKADAETGLQHREERDQHKIVEMADQVRGTDQRQGFQFGFLQGGRLGFSQCCGGHWSLCARLGFGTTPIMSASAS